MNRTLFFGVLSLLYLFSCTNQNRPRVLTEDFDGFPLGSLTEFETTQCIWTSPAGNAAITDRKAKSAPNALRIHGGKDRSVVVTPVENIGTHKEITFWAEQWTYREPFEFSVSGYANDNWEELFNGSEQIKAGNFPSFVEIPLSGSDYTKYKFSCTAPENAGVLIDDLNIYNDAPLTLDSISVRHVQVPILKGNEHAPVLQVRIHTSGVTGSLNLNKLLVDFTGTSEIKDLDKAGLYYTGSNPDFSPETLVAESTKLSINVAFDGKQALKQGINYFWLSVKIKDDADITHVVEAACVEAAIGNTTVQPSTANPGGISRLGIALRKHNDDDVDTYRIPGLETTNEGTLLAVYDVRRNSETDLQEDVDIGMNRSTDGGKTWEPMKVIMDMEEWGGLPEIENGIGDPAILVDRQTNTIWVAAIWAHGHPGQRNWNASKPGLSPEETSQLMVVRSDDDGRTWSEEINITRQLKDPKWHLVLQGPGKGITLKDGTLVFPAQFKDENQVPHSTIIWSKDRGKTWHIGTGAKESTTEAQVIEQNDGLLMINMRDDRNRTDLSETNGRAVYTTENLGKSWIKHSTSGTNTLQESTCQASLIKEQFMVDGSMSSLVIFSNPNTKSGRHHMSIKISFDDGESWDLSKTLLLDEGHGRGYSCLTKVDDQTLGILYEGSQADMTFQLIKVEELLGKP